MKTTINLTFAIIIGAAILLTACKKDEKESGIISIEMTDAPANYTAVNVDVRSVEVHHSKDGWTSLRTNAGIYDLLKLRDSVSVLLVNNAALPAGRINQMRLLLGDSNTIVIDSVNVFPLETPSAQESGLKFNVNAEIKDAGKTEIVLDFDANESIVEKGEGEYLLKPVIKVKKIVYY